jgi:hypothetical protein
MPGVHGTEQQYCCTGCCTWYWQYLWWVFGCMYASKRITQQPCHNPLPIIFIISIMTYMTSLHVFFSSILSWSTQHFYRVTTHSNLRTLPLLSYPCPCLPSHTCPSHTSIHLCCPPHLILISQEKHPHLLTNHAHITYIQWQAHTTTHLTWLTQPCST